MEIGVTLNVQNKQLPLDYRPVFVSLIKALLSKHYPADYERLYLSGNMCKDFTFAIHFSEPKFAEDKVTFSNKKITMTISSADEYYSLLFYNAFQKAVGYSHPLADAGTLEIAAVSISPQKRVTTGSAQIKFLSPLVVRQHERGIKDRYYIYNDEEFSQCLCAVTEKQLGRKVEIKLEAIKPYKTVALSFGTKIRCSLGIYNIVTDKDALDILSKSGIGSRRGEGYGFFRIVGAGNE